MNRTVQAVLKSAMPVLALGGALMLLGPTDAMAQRGGGRGHSGPTFSGRQYNGGGGRRYSASVRRYEAPVRRYAAPYVARGYSPGRFYAGRGYFYSGRFYARPYFGIGIGIPFGWGYYTRAGCGYYDGFGYWHQAPCYPGIYAGY